MNSFLISHKKFKYTFVLLCAILSSCIQSLQAQPFSLDKNLKPLELNLKPYKGKDAAHSGKAITCDAIATSDTNYYFVKGCGIYQTVFFNIESANRDIVINLCKDNWKKSEQKGSLDKNGKWHSVFRTEGSFGIQVITRTKNAKYKLTIWLSDEPKKINMPSPFKIEPIKK